MSTFAFSEQAQSAGGESPPDTPGHALTYVHVLRTDPPPGRQGRRRKFDFLLKMSQKVIFFWHRFTVTHGCVLEIIVCKIFLAVVAPKTWFRVVLLQ